METLVFVPVNPTSYSEMLALAKAFAPEYKILFFIDNSFVRGRLDEIISHHFEYYDSEIFPRGKTDKLLRKVSTLGLMLSSMGKESFLKRKFRRNFLLKEKKVVQFLTSYKKIKAIFVYGDRHTGTIEMNLIRAAKTARIPVVIPPLAFFSGEQNLIAQRKMDGDCNFPEVWNGVEKYELLAKKDLETGKKYLYYPKWLTEVLIEMHLMPANPWVMGGGGADFVWADSQNARLLLEKAGCDSKKLRVTGHLSHDDLYRSVGREGSAGEKKNVIIALPQLGEHGLLPWKKHWEEIEFLVSQLESLEVNAFVSLHPKMIDPKYEEICSRFGVTILKDRLKNALSRADIFLSTFSSTVPWAIGLKKPMIIFDFYGLGYNLYDDDGLIVCRDKNDFRAKLINLVSNEEFFKNEITKLNAIAHKYPQIDGQSLERMKFELSRL